MAINQIQLPQLQRRIPDIAGQFIRGRQDKRAEERHNRLLKIQEGNISLQRDKQAADEKKAEKKEEEESEQEKMNKKQKNFEDRQAAAQAELRFWDRSLDVLEKDTPENLQKSWQTVLEMAIKEGVDVDGLPATLTPADMKRMRTKVLVGLHKKPTETSLSQNERAQLLEDTKSEDPVVAESARIALGLAPRAVGSASQTITSEGTADDVAATEGTIAEEVAGAKVTGASKAKAKSAPLIAKTESFINTQVKLADKAATERGEVLTDLARAKAALPGLTDVVTKLRELAPIATSTFGGRVWDAAVKETGFGATKGKTASTKFGAMVNNQVLPLLKPTFGAAFTKPEGDALRATMGDVDASVDEKMAALDAFMEQKLRDIETKERQLGGGVEAGAEIGADAVDQGVIMIDAQGNRARVFLDGRVEEL